MDEPTLEEMVNVIRKLVHIPLEERHSIISAIMDYVDTEEERNKVLLKVQKMFVSVDEERMKTLN